ncbi:hypothetical protein [Vandammella animalimorsus]|uniref:hypothetical protein n=1 Tax=Vandammella animalimorsus TaxID=2029117 RepID=UPI001177AD3B|nr:hypothetical protein [Vandammella animalimorsus]
MAGLLFDGKSKGRAGAAWLARQPLGSESLLKIFARRARARSSLVCGMANALPPSLNRFLPIHTEVLNRPECKARAVLPKAGGFQPKCLSLSNSMFRC